MFTNLDKGYFQLARSASKNSDYDIQVGCVVSLHGKPVSIGWNVVKTHPIYTANSHRCTIHAEIKAVISAQCDLQGAIAYVYRETANGIPALAKPCNLCYGVLSEAGIKKVFYSIDRPPYYSKELVI